VPPLLAIIRRTGATPPEARTYERTIKNGRLDK